MRRKDETKWGKGYCQDRAKKEGHHHGYSYCPDSGDKMGKEDREDLSNRKERLRNKDRPAMQLYQPGARNRKPRRAPLCGRIYGRGAVAQKRA
uniref:Uncharacterized protein n=1 Tax=Fundulus heteroclitus TaxID=8078 RepID=A0A3Q2QHZ6_FUNHE